MSKLTFQHHYFSLIFPAKWEITQNSYL